MNDQMLLSNAPIGVEAFENAYRLAIECAESNMNCSEDGRIEPMLVSIEKFDPWNASYDPMRRWDPRIQFGVSECDLRSVAEALGAEMVIHFESVWQVHREMPKDAIDYSIDAAMQPDRQLVMQFRLASQDSLAVAYCPIRFFWNQWGLVRSKLVFPKMAFNGAGEVTFFAGADA